MNLLNPENHYQSLSASKLFSVVIPTHNRHKQLEACLLSLAQLSIPKNLWDVIVVDDGSDPDVKLSPEVLRAKLTIIVLKQAGQGPAHARNVGVATSDARYILFTDDDCIPHSGWAQALISELEKYPELAVGGKTINGLPRNVYSEASQRLNSYVYDYYNNGGAKPRFFASNNLGLSRELFQAMGGFSTNYTTNYSEDRDFSDKWFHSGRKMKYVPEGTISHHHHLTFYTFLRQHFRYGTGARSFHLERRLRDMKPPPVEPLGFYVDMIKYSIDDLKGAKRIRMMILVALTQISHTLGYLWMRIILEHVPRPPE